MPFVFTLLALNVSAQVGVFVAPHVGFQLESFNTTGVNTFFDTWNEHYKLGMKQPFESVGSFSNRGIDYGINVVAYGDLKKTTFYASLGVFYNQSAVKRSSTMWNNYSNEFNLHFRDVEVPIMIGAAIKGKFTLALNADFLFRQAMLDFTTVYPDGSKSYGNDFDINGVYKVSVPDMYLGPALIIRLGRVQFPISVTFPLGMFKNNDLPLTDYDANRWRSTNFPERFDDWLTDVSGMDQENALYMNQMKGMKIMVGLEFLIGKMKD